MEELWGHKGGFDIKRKPQNKRILMRSTERIKNRGKFGQIAVVGANGEIKCEGVM
jgi:hypothetical protein